MSTLVPPHRLRARFAVALAEMYGREVPAYRDLVEVVQAVNAEVSAQGGEPQEPGGLARVSAERHGAIRVGSADELRRVARLFALLGMHPVGFYDLREAAPGSAVPVISTAFRPVERDELARNPFRVFTSMLVTDDPRFFGDPDLRRAVEGAIASRRMFGARLEALLADAERAGGVTEEGAEAFLTEAVAAFALPVRPVPKKLYDALLAVSPVAADIFVGLNINHLTPRVLDIDEANRRMESERGIRMKDQVEGPPRRRGAEVLLRQTSFRSLPETIRFAADDGAESSGTRRVRFGEIEQRGVALTPAGRKIYDDLLDAWEQEWAADPSGDYQERWAARFDAKMPAAHAELAARGLAWYTYHPTPRGVGARPMERDPERLVAAGLLARMPIIYEDFLPRSAAGIFQSNLGAERGRRDDHAAGSAKGPATLAEAIGRAPLDPMALCAAERAASLALAEAALGLGPGALRA